MTALKQLHPGWIAAGIGMLAALWLASGLGKSAPPGTSDLPRDESTAPAVSVRVMNSEAQDLIREATVSARTAALRTVTLRAEVSGLVTEVLVERGQLVESGQVLVKLAVNDRAAQLRRAQAILTQRELQYRAAQRLQQKGHQSEVDLAAAQANWAAAEADLQNRTDELAATVIRAPFAGVLEARPVEIGQYLKAGDEVARLMQRQPFLVRGQVTEDVIGFLKAGQSGKAVINGKEYPGRLRFAARQADSRTRTFEVELEISNQDNDLVAGISAILLLPMDTVRAHVLDTVMLTLNDAGDFGIKTVNSQGLVEFHPARIAQSRDASVWLSGLPDSLQVISVGQGFVSAGQTVTASVIAE